MTTLNPYDEECLYKAQAEIGNSLDSICTEKGIRYICFINRGLALTLSTNGRESKEKILGDVALMINHYLLSDAQFEDRKKESL